MKFLPASAAACVALCLATLPGNSTAQTPAQTTSAPLRPGQPAPQEPAPPPSSQATPKGQVIFSRSIDENGDVTSDAKTGIGSAARQPEIKSVSGPTASDAERRAVTYTGLDLDVHLRPAEQQIAVRAQLTVRNDSKTALEQIPLQISSSLNWERVRIDGKDVAFTVATLNSDTDHTGQLHEAAVPLGEPLAPGESAKLDVTYWGAIAADAKRLLAVGTPDDVALLSDWDQIGVAFTGLRGFGNVAWYPVSSVPAILGDGARVFDEIGEHKLRLAGAHFRLRLAVESPRGQAPTVAIVNGVSAALTVTDAEKGSETPSVATADLGMTLGFEAPSLFVAVRALQAGASMNAWTLPDNSNSAEAWNSAAAAVAPFLKGWLGERPRSPLTLLDLPDAHDLPFENGAMLAVPIQRAPSDQLQVVLAHALSHAHLDSGSPLPAWLDEGVANFMGTLWIEKQLGREKALESLEAGRAALALAEPGSPGESAGQPLAHAISPVYYRTKAAYVLWMLRDIAGDTALSAALRAYDPAKDPPAGADRGGFEKLLEQSGDHRALSWFFADWVDADHGLPDLAIESVFPSSATADSSIVTIRVSNNGYAAAEVPLTVRSDMTSVTERVLIPARGMVSRRILVQGKPIEVQLNDGAVPETQASVHITKLDQPAGVADPPAGP